MHPLLPGLGDATEAPQCEVASFSLVGTVRRTAPGGCAPVGASGAWTEPFFEGFQAFADHRQ